MNSRDTFIFIGLINDVIKRVNRPQSDHSDALMHLHTLRDVFVILAEKEDVGPKELGKYYNLLDSVKKFEVILENTNSISEPLFTQGYEVINNAKQSRYWKGKGGACLKCDELETHKDWCPENNRIVI
jgi:hypothetical protein